MALPKLKDIKCVTTDCYGTLIDWEKGIGDAFKKQADRDGLTLDMPALLERFFEAHCFAALWIGLESVGRCHARHS
jgi:2-haloacid dehalogenase/putative hydrolase of the HAD superfamily